jgi:hypothetical protein
MASSDDEVWPSNAMLSHGAARRRRCARVLSDDENTPPLVIASKLTVAAPNPQQQHTLMCRSELAAAVVKRALPSAASSTSYISSPIGSLGANTLSLSCKRGDATTGNGRGDAGTPCEAAVAADTDDATPTPAPVPLDVYDPYTPWLLTGVKLPPFDSAGGGLLSACSLSPASSSSSGMLAGRGPCLRSNVSQNGDDAPLEAPLLFSECTATSTDVVQVSSPGVMASPASPLAAGQMVAVAAAASDLNVQPTRNGCRDSQSDEEEDEELLTIRRRPRAVF